MTTGKGKNGDSGGGDEDRALWEHETADVRALKKPSRKASSAQGRKPRSIKKTGVKNGRVSRDDLPAGFPPPLDGHSAEKLRRGEMKIGGKIDLHGMTEAQAYEALRDFITRSAGGRQKLVLVITGKGGAKGTGALKKNVPRWLSAPDLARYISHVGPARAEHGGAGALYVVLRRLT